MLNFIAVASNPSLLINSLISFIRPSSKSLFLKGISISDKLYSIIFEFFFENFSIHFLYHHY